MTAEGKVVSLASTQREARFLDLLDRSIREAPEAVQPVPSNWAARMQALREKAEANQRDERMEC